MKELIGKFTFRKPRQLIRPTVCIFLEDFFNLFSAIIIYFAINMLAGAFSDPTAIKMKTLGILCVLLLVLTLIQYVIGRGAYHNTHVISGDWIADDRIEFVKKLRRLPLGFFSRKKSGELINNFTGDFVNIQMAIIGTFSGLFSVILAVILTAIGMFLFSPAMAAAFYVSLPIAAVILILSTRTLERLSDQIAGDRDKAATYLNEYLLGMKTLKSYNQTGEGFGKLKSAYYKLMQSSIRAESGPGSLMRLCTSIVQFGLPLMCLTGSYLLLGGEMCVVEFISLIIIGTKIAAPVVTAVTNIFMLRMNYVSAKRLDNTMKESEMSGASKPSADPEIRFENVSFAYSKDADLALKNVSFTVPKGKLTAIVGSSGSGKSTVLRLLARFWDVSNGDILCANTPLTDISPEAWQEEISMVRQGVYLFHETVRENILFGRKDATEEQMIDAAQRAGCHDFITALPDGYDTVVGEGGSTLSGGEKQRISIARAILKQAPLLLLDEPTASLDALNEVLVQRAVGDLVQNTTVVMIAHRLKTVQYADQILVMDKGEVKECGTHTELMTQKGIYARLWDLQRKSTDWNITTK